MNRFKRSTEKKTGFGAPEPSETNWFAMVLLVAAGLLLCFLLYALLAPVLFGDEPEYEIVPYGGDLPTATPPPTFTFAPQTSATPVIAPQETTTPALAVPITASTAPQLAQFAAIGGISAEVSSAVFAPDGARFAAGSYDGSVRVWDAVTLLPLHQFRTPSNRVNSIAFSPRGDQIAIGGQDQVVRLWSFDTGDEIALDGPNAAVRAVAFSPDGARLAAASDDRVIYVWDTTSSPPTLADLLAGHTSYVTSVAFSPDGSLIAAGGEDDTIRLWTVRTGTERAVLRGHTSTVTSVAFAPDGTAIVSTSADKTVRLWNLLSESTLAVMQGHTENVHDAAFSPDGSLVISAGSGIEDNGARFWDARSGAELRARLAMPGPLNSLAFSPDGTLLLAGGATYLTLWHAAGIAPAPAPTAAVPTASIPTTGATGASGQGGALVCTLTVRSATANRRSGPGTQYSVVGTLTAGQSVQAAGWATDAEQYTWWQLADSTWVRGDAFISAAFPDVPQVCLELPPASGISTAPAATALPTTSAAQSSSTAICTLTVRSAEANQRSGPGTDYTLAGTLTAGQSVQATGWARAADGYTWWRLGSGLWVRGDAFVSAAFPDLPAACLRLPAASSDTPAPTAQDGGTCVLTVRRAEATLYRGPDATYPVAGTVVAGQTAQPTGWAQADDGYTWWRLSDGSWARGDIFLDATHPSVPQACLTLPQATP